MVHKPERWAVNAAEVAREWQWAWRDLLGIWSLDPFAFDPLGTGLASGVLAASQTTRP